MKHITLLISILLLTSSTLCAQEKNKNKVNPDDNITEAEIEAQKLKDQSHKLWKNTVLEFGKLEKKANKLRDLERSLNNGNSSENDYDELKRKILDFKLELANANLEAKLDKAKVLHNKARSLEGKEKEDWHMAVSSSIVWLNNDLSTMQSRVQDKIKEINKVPEKKEVGKVVIVAPSNDNLSKPKKVTNLSQEFKTRDEILSSLPNNLSEFQKEVYTLKILLTKFQRENYNVEVNTENNQLIITRKIINRKATIDLNLLNFFTGSLEFGYINFHNYNGPYQFKDSHKYTETEVYSESAGVLVSYKNWKNSNNFSQEIIKHSWEEEVGNSSLNFEYYTYRNPNNKETSLFKEIIGTLYRIIRLNK